MQVLRVSPETIGDLYIAVNPRTGRREAAELLHAANLPTGRCLEPQCSKHKCTMLFLHSRVQVEADDILSATGTSRHVPTTVAMLALDVCRLARWLGAIFSRIFVTIFPGLRHSCQ